MNTKQTIPTFTEVFCYRDEIFKVPVRVEIAVRQVAHKTFEVSGTSQFDLRSGGKIVNHVTRHLERWTEHFAVSQWALAVDAEARVIHSNFEVLNSLWNKRML
jgi:uncharacterized protein YxjI